jgi:hypothetical protein
MIIFSITSAKKFVYLHMEEWNLTTVSICTSWWKKLFYLILRRWFK